MSARDRKRFARPQSQYMRELGFSDAVSAYGTRNHLYAYLHHYFFHYLPQPIREHRYFFSQQGRGYGEEAFHSMWYLLLKQFPLRSLLEIGVFRGQVISLWALIAKQMQSSVDIHCISPFSSMGDQVSAYPQLDYLSDTLNNFSYFGLPAPKYHRALSTAASAIEYMREHRFDCIYIDGGHDFEVVLSDYQSAVASLNPGGLLIMDDSSLHTDFSPPAFSFAGHPGPSRVAREFADKQLRFIAGVGHQNIYRKA